MRRARVFLAAILLLTLLVTACGAQIASGAAPQSALDILEQAAPVIPEIDLPALTLTYNEEGVPSIFGFSTTRMQSVLGVDLSFLNLDPVFIDWFMRSNLQHVQIQHTANGLFLFANGQLLPSVSWNADSLSNAVDVAEMWGVSNSSVIKRLVPVLQKLGIHVILQFPVASGNESIATREMGATLPEAPAPEGEVPAFHLALEYGEDGVPSTLGLTTRDVLTLIGLNLTFLELDSSLVQEFTTNNLQSVEAETQADGIYLYLNGQEIPHLAYSPEQIENLAALYGQMYPEGDPRPSLLRTVSLTVQRADIDLIAEFPLAAGAEQLPLHAEMGAGN